MRCKRGVEQGVPRYNLKTYSLAGAGENFAVRQNRGEIAVSWRRGLRYRREMWLGWLVTEDDCIAHFVAQSGVNIEVSVARRHLQRGVSRNMAGRRGSTMPYADAVLYDTQRLP